MCSDWTKDGRKTGDYQKICGLFYAEHSNGTNIAQELKEYLDQEFDEIILSGSNLDPTAKMQTCYE